jgi:hypothetical protein
MTKTAGIILSLSLVVGCKKEPDPDAELRARYVKTLIDRADAGARFSLYDSDEVVFDDGWYNPGWFVPPSAKAGMFARPMREHALLRLRSHGRRPMRLVLDGIPQIEHDKGPVWLTVAIDGQHIGFFPVHGRLRAELDVPPEVLPESGWVDVGLQASYVTFPPGDGRPISYRLVSVAWEPKAP